MGSHGDGKGGFGKLGGLHHDKFQIDPVFVSVDFRSEKRGEEKQRRADADNDRRNFSQDFIIYFGKHNHDNESDCNCRNLNGDAAFPVVCRGAGNRNDAERGEGEDCQDQQLVDCPDILEYS